MCNDNPPPRVAHTAHDCHRLRFGAILLLVSRFNRAAKIKSEGLMKTNLLPLLPLLPLASIGLLLSSAAGAQTQRAADAYPNKPIRVIVPQAPGGSNDLMARTIGGQLGERLGRQVVVDNRPGAEGMIGSELVARAAPDGYTLLMASTAFTMNPAVVKKLPYDPIKDFTFAALFGRGPVLITVGPSLPVNSVKELVALGKAKPNHITFASAGGFMHFVSAMFRNHVGIEATIALYKGGVPALTDVSGGHVHMAVATIPSAGPSLRAGKVRALAIGSAKRLTMMPDLPTVGEAGFPGYEASIWWAWAAAGGTPDAVINKLNSEVEAILKLPETAKRFVAEGAEVETQTPAQLREMIKTDLVKWEKVAQDAKMAKQ
jgi:tripartite-type tricarboxylate transporter receptor subunit TctC